MIYEYKDSERGFKRTTYYYKPKNYRKYIAFTKSGDVFGTPEHHVTMPQDVKEVKTITRAMKDRIKFLDYCFGRS